MKFIVSKEFFDKVEDVCFGIIVARGIDNNKHYDFIDELLTESLVQVQATFENKKVKETPPITYYREAFQKLGINPNRFMCSIEALTSRVVKNQSLPAINPLVDLGNALSLKYLIPLGIHNIDSFNGDIMLREATQDDHFIPFGATSEDPPEAGEIVYVSGNDVKTRRWTWRQGENGKITNNTRNVFIPLDAFEVNKYKMLELQTEFQKILTEQMQAQVTIGWVDKNNREFEF